MSNPCSGYDITSNPESPLGIVPWSFQTQSCLALRSLEPVFVFIFIDKLLTYEFVIMLKPRLFKDRRSSCNQTNVIQVNGILANM